MIVRDVDSKDFPNLCNLYIQLVGEACDYEKMLAVLDETKDDLHYRLLGVYNEADELVGTATLTKCLDLTGDCRYYYNLENFIIDEKYRGKGYGRYLMRKVEDFVKNQNGSYINFTSSVFRTDAHEFYYKMGYSKDYVKGFKKRFK